MESCLLNIVPRILYYVLNYELKLNCTLVVTVGNDNMLITALKPCGD